MPGDIRTALFVLGALWIACALIPRPVRLALRDGMRCMGRYPDLWRIPLAFGVCHGVFQFSQQAALAARMRVDLREWLSAVVLDPLPSIAVLAPEAAMAAAESTAAIFTIFLSTFPLSAACALAFLLNVNGLLVETMRAIRRRFPIAGWPLCAILLISALSAIARPALFLLLPEASERLSFYGVATISLLGIVFEYLLGVFFLTYLMLMAFAWMRGLQFHRYKLLLVTARRTGFVLKWSLVLAGLLTLLIVIPQLLALVFDDTHSAQARFLRDASDPWGSLVVVAIALVFCPIQAVLVFHNESLRDAARDSFRFLAVNAPVIAPFLVAVFVPCLALGGMRIAAGFMLGWDSAAFAAVRTALSAANALLAGWLIASWVCLYKTRSSARKEIPF